MRRLLPLLTLFVVLAWSALGPSATAQTTGAIPGRGLALWLRADSAVTTDPAGLVERWHDVSGAGHDALPHDAAARPHLVLDGPNGRPALRFDGTSDFLAVAHTPALAAERLTVFVVASMDGARHDAETRQGPFLLKVSDANWNDGYGLARFDGQDGRNAEFFVEDWANTNAQLPLPFGTYALYSGRYDGHAVELSVDGGAVAAYPYDGSVEHTTEPLLLAAGPESDGERNYLQGDLAEVLVYDRALTDAERTSVEQYLGRKYGLQIRPVPTAGLTLWLRADRGVVTGGDASDAVYRWGDYSGLGHDAYQNDPVQTPARATEGSVQAVVFDRDDFLAVADAPALNPERLTLFVVGRVAASTGRWSPFVSKASDFSWADGYGLAVTHDAGEGKPDVDVGFYVTDFTQYTAEHAVAPEVYTLYTGRHDGDSVQLRVDEMPVGAVSYDGVVTGNDQPLYLGASTDGEGAPPRQFLTGAVAEVLLYDRALSDAERTVVERYLAAKYGIAPGTGTAAEDEAVVPGSYALSAAYPNPFNPQARFTLEVAQAQPVRVELFDVLGRSVALLHDGVLAPGAAHTFTIDGHGLPSGSYLYRATGATFTVARAVTLLK